MAFSKTCCRLDLSFSEAFVNELQSLISSTSPEEFLHSLVWDCACFIFSEVVVKRTKRHFSGLHFKIIAYNHCVFLEPQMLSRYQGELHKLLFDELNNTPSINNAFRGRESGLSITATEMFSFSPPPPVL